MDTLFGISVGLLIFAGILLFAAECGKDGEKDGKIEGINQMQQEAVKHNAAHWETIPSKNGEPAVVKFVWNDNHKMVEF